MMLVCFHPLSGKRTWKGGKGFFQFNGVLLFPSPFGEADLERQTKAASKKFRVRFPSPFGEADLESIL